MEIKKIVIAKDSRHYLAWPDLVRTRSGRLLCVFSACTHHCNRAFTQILLAHSDDGGHNWSPARELSEPCGTQVGYYYNNASISQLADGRIAVVFDRIAGKNENVAPSRIQLYFSTDDGITWGSAISTPAEGIVPDRLFETASGRWLLACHHHDTATGKLVQRLWYSDDQGTRWQGPVTVGKSPDLNLCEASIMDVNGTLVAFMRENSCLGLPIYRSFSTDDGKSWSEVSPFPLPGGHRPKAGRLQDGRILISYRFYQGGKTECRNIFLGLSDEESVLNSDYRGCSTRILPLDTDTSMEADTGYSGWVQMPDGSLYIANYIMDGAAKAYIRGYDLPLEELNLQVNRDIVVEKQQN